MPIKGLKGGIGTKALGYGLGAAVEETDAEFNQTVLLLHGDGTNGEQNNTFVDSSTSNHTITRNGDTTQGTFSPFSLEDGYWSVNLDGNDSISFPNSSAFTFGTGAFTIEFWVNAPLNNDKFLFGARGAIGTMHITFGGYGGSTAGSLRYKGSSTITTGTDLIADNTWHHCAIERDGSNNVTLYIDGVSKGTGTDTTNYTSTTGNFGIGYSTFSGGNQMTGYLSNFRIVKGSNVYGGAFTPPTTPLTAVADTQLLTLQSNRFVDNSTNGIVISNAGGDPSVQPFSPFAPSRSYSKDAVGGSAYFDGTGDYLTIPDSTDFTLGTNNFSLEFWIYPTRASTKEVFYSQSNSAAFSYAIVIEKTASNLLHLYTTTSGQINAGGSTTLSMNQWYWIQIVRADSTTLKVYLNGVEEISLTSASLNSPGIVDRSEDVYIGSAIYNYPYQGYISSLRFINGTSNAASSPPTAPLTSTGSETKLLTNFTNAGIIDHTMRNNLETEGDAQIDTSVKKFGTGSMYFDGTGDYLYLPSNENLVMGTGDFTIEMFFYYDGGSSWSGFSYLIDQRNTATQVAITIYANASTSNFEYYVSGANQISNITLPSVRAWHHFAAVRYNGSTKVYINGTHTGGTYSDTNDYVAPQTFIGARFNVTNFFNGYIDELRITKGVARYTSNFTAPTKAFANK